MTITKTNGFQTLTRVVTTVLAFLYLINVFAKNSLLTKALAVLMIAVFLLGFFIMNKTNRLVCSVLAIVGIALLTYYKVPFGGWVSAINKNIATVTLIYFAPILSMPFFYNPYQDELKKVCNRYITTAAPFLLITCLFSFFLAFYMSMAGVPVIFALLYGIAKEYRCEKTFTLSVIVGNAIAMAAAPTTASGVVLPATGIAYWEMLVFGGILALVTIFASYFVFKSDLKKEESVVLEKDMTTTVKWSNLLALLALFVFLSVVIIAIDNYTPISLLAGVSLLAIPFAAVMALVQNKWAVVQKRLNIYKGKNMLTNPNIMTIIGVAGFAGEGMKRAQFMQVVSDFFGSHQELSLLFPLIIITIATAVAVVGVHPMAMGQVLASLLTPEMLHTSSVGVAMIILIGWCYGLIVSPFSSVTNLASAQSGFDVWDISAKRMLKWSVVCILIATVVIDAYTLLGI